MIDNFIFIQIAELHQCIEKLDRIIEVHQKTTRDQFMINQYVFKRNEHETELKALYATLLKFKIVRDNRDFYDKYIAQLQKEIYNESESVLEEDHAKLALISQ